MIKTVRLLEEDRVGLLLIEEKEHKNTFSWDFIRDFEETFDYINNRSNLKVVVARGYGNYFCCGATQEQLLGIADGKYKFSDAKFYDWFLRCRLPVVAAMDGHALGGGLALGCYADIMILAEERYYSANFTRYGFTPDMGADYMIPLKFGVSLGGEMLFHGKNYSGRELKARGAPLNILPQDQVLDSALEIAGELADKPSLSLALLKEQLTRKIKADLPKIIEKEEEAHRLTFAQSEVREKIEKRFGG